MPPQLCDGSTIILTFVVVVVVVVIIIITDLYSAFRSENTEALTGTGSHPIIVHNILDMYLREQTARRHTVRH